MCDCNNNDDKTIYQVIKNHSILSEIKKLIDQDQNLKSKLQNPNLNITFLAPKNKGINQFVKNVPDCINLDEFTLSQILNFHIGTRSLNITKSSPKNIELLTDYGERIKIENLYLNNNKIGKASPAFNSNSNDKCCNRKKTFLIKKKKCSNGYLYIINALLFPINITSQFC